MGFWALGAVAVWLWVASPRLPAGPDIYVHLLWTQQAMVCLRQGSLPLWLPDLNAGFGSPGIRLYSPAGPFLAGLFGLFLGDAGRGLRFTVALSVAALFFLVRRRLLPNPSGWSLLWIASPILPFILFHRGAFSEVYALPLSFWLLHPPPQASSRPFKLAAIWALLWLVHAPSFLMTSLLSFLSILGRRSLKAIGHWLGSWGLGLLAVAWHWLPLWTEQVAARSGLTAGIFDFRRNFLAFAQAHDPLAVADLGWLAVCWGGVLLLCQGRISREGLLTTASLFLASPLSYPLWIALPPLAFLQFPWRFLTPASLLLPGVVAGNRRPSKQLLGLLLFCLPHLWLPNWRTLGDPRLHGRETWQSLGEKVYKAFSANPLLVDAQQNRPPAFSLLADNIPLFGQNALLCPGPCEVKMWKPLRKEVEVDGPGGRLRFRILAYPFWRAKVDGRPIEVSGSQGTVSVWVPPGKHRVVVYWAGNAAARLGWLGAILAFFALTRWEHHRKKP